MSIDINVVNAGNCIICGKPIEIVPVPVIRNYRFSDIFFCPECEKKASNERREKEDEAI